MNFTLLDDFKAFEQRKHDMSKFFPDEKQVHQYLCKRAGYRAKMDPNMEKLYDRQ